MSYAINVEKNGWRSINSESDLLDGETYSDTQPVLLAQVKALKIDTLYAAYADAIAQPVSYTSVGGVAQIFDADPSAIANVQSMLAAFNADDQIPSGFYWMSATDVQVAFTLVDLQGLAKAMGEQGWSAFTQLQKLKAEVNVATTVAAVQAINW